MPNHLIIPKKLRIEEWFLLNDTKQIPTTNIINDVIFKVSIKSRILYGYFLLPINLRIVA